MKCPNCNLSLRRFFYHGSSIDVCISCGGVLFEGQELRKFIIDFLSNNPDIPEARIDFDKNIKTKAEMNPSNVSLICPKCAGQMQVFNFAYDSNIILDRCDACDSVWVDGKEIHELAVHFKGNKGMHDLGRAMAKELEQFQRLRQLAEIGGSLGQSASRTLVYLPKIVLPLRDTIQRNIFPVATIGVIAINILIFIYQSVYITNHELFFNWFGMVPSKLVSDSMYFTLLTSMFLHADFWHLVGNMFFLWLFGDNIEESLGRIRFLTFYVLAGIFSGVAFALMNLSLNMPAFGASGAIAGIMGVYFILFAHAKIKTLVINQVIDIPVYFYLGGWIITQVIWSLLGVPGVAWFAHISGFIFGMLFGLLYKRGCKRGYLKL